MNTNHPKTQDQRNHKPTLQRTQQQKSRQAQGSKKQGASAPRVSVTHFDQELPETRMFR